VTEALIKTRAEKQAELPGFILERTAKRMKQFFQQQLTAADAGITIDQWVILQVLDQQEGLSQLDIARATYKDAPTVTRIIDLLCQKGLTRRLADPADRRRFKIELTPVGRDKIQAVLPVIQAARREAWRGLQEAEIGQLADILNTIFDNLGLPAED
jgi:DNA-binding MarR family transcriptional regulator